MGVTHSLPLLTGEQDRESPDPGSPGRAGGEERRTTAGCGLYARSLPFVAGDLERRGGAHLLHAVGDLPDIEVDIVTSGKVEPRTGVHCRVHRGLRPADRALQDLYRTADVFAMPSRGACMPQALAEAAAAGLALLSTPVGAIPEILHDG
ncbi:MAG TPA: glycosyltransferase [Candidatus Dormibacteraeota bacterium]|nr:glycosyltransferase [Candidatus Dormibacteraeota bacterium]